MAVRMPVRVPPSATSMLPKKAAITVPETREAMR